MRVYKVGVEWLLQGKGEKPQVEFVTVVASTAFEAQIAAVKHFKSGWVEKLQRTSVESIERCVEIDIVAK